MNKYVAFLRAINVAGHAKIKMSHLEQVLMTLEKGQAKLVIDFVYQIVYNYA